MARLMAGIMAGIAIFMAFCSRRAWLPGGEEYVLGESSRIGPLIARGADGGDFKYYSSHRDK